MRCRKSTVLVTFGSAKIWMRFKSRVPEITKARYTVVTK